MNRQQAVNFLKILKYDFEQNALKAEKEIKKHMGYDSEGLAKVIYWYENKEKKMTREEAMLKIRKANIGPEVAEVNLRILEALGLIKFDEPSPIERETIKLSKFADDIGYMGSINGLLGLAEKHGLSIKEDNPK